MITHIALGADHAGFTYKEAIKNHLAARGVESEDFGTHSADSVDYPDFVHPVAESIEAGRHAFGVVVCGSANGVSMTVNKHQGIRGAIAWEKDLAALARQHNNANVLCLPARFISLELALELVDTFLATEFEGGRHARRVGKIACS
ncbi:MAG: ribose 5-phosphate isomerase B [Bacteroidota bacterium]